MATNFCGTKESGYQKDQHAMQNSINLHFVSLNDNKVQSFCIILKFCHFLQGEIMRKLLNAV